MVRFSSPVKFSWLGFRNQFNLHGWVFETSLFLLFVGISRVGLEVEIVDEEGHCQQSCLHLNTFVVIIRIAIARNVSDS